MNFKQRLTEKKSHILKSWQEAILTARTEEAPGFLEKQEALIAAATGYSMGRGIEGLFDALLQGVISDEASRFLGSMIGIRAANDFKASHTVAFILEIKKAARRELGAQILDDPGLQEELIAWESVVDDMALFAFDIYIQSRENVLERRADKEKQETLRLLKKAKLIPDDQE